MSQHERKRLTVTLDYFDGIDPDILSGYMIRAAHRVRMFLESNGTHSDSCPHCQDLKDLSDFSGVAEGEWSIKTVGGNRP